MKKRIVCILLTLLMLVSMVPTAALTANAASNLSVSEAGIAFIKMVEGYTKTAVWDNSQYSYGYGTKAEKAGDTISQTDADTALREELKEVDKAVNSFAATYGKNFTQAQHDALVSFSFNVGTGWMTTDGVFRQAVINGATGNAFLNAISLWGNSASVPTKGLINRRLNEADMFLNGNYPTSKTPRSNYRFVYFNDNDGANPYDLLGDNKIQGFNANDTVPFAKVPERSGYRFLGWYTQSTGGNWIPSLSSGIKTGTTLYAHWQAIDGSDGSISGSNIVGLAADYKLSVSYAASLNIYEKASATSTITGTAKAGSTVKVVAEYMDNNNVKWVKLSTGGWMKISEVKESTGTNVSTPTNLVVTVTNAYINVRETPGTSATHKIVNKVYYGEKLTIVEVVTHNKALWGRYEGGWVALMYTDYDEVIKQTSQGGESTTEKVIATGVVNTANTPLRIREGASVSYTQVGSLQNGTRVSIYEITTHNGHRWGRIAEGWICLDYVVLDAEPVTPNQGATTVTPTTVANGKTTDATNVHKEATTASEVVETLKANTEISILEVAAINSVVWGRISTGWLQLSTVTVSASGVVTTVTGGNLNVREDAGTASALVETIPNGSKVTITALKAVGDSVWGKVGTGRWVSLNLVKLSVAVTSGSTGTGTSDSTSTGNTTTAKQTGVITNADVVNVRVAAGVRNDLATTLARGTKVNVYEQTTVDKATWCRIDEGWVAMMYVNLDVISSTGTSTGTGNGNGSTSVLATGTVSSTMNLRVRDGAGVGYNEVASLPTGTKVVIYEKTTVKGVAWGRIDRGWICLTYITLDSASSSVIGSKGVGGVVVNCATGVNIRSTASVSGALVGSAALGSTVTIYEQQLVGGAYWGRTDKGWVCMDYIRLDASALPDSTGPVTGTTTPSTGTTTGGTTSGSTTVTAPSTGTLVKDVDARVNADATSTVVDNLKTGASVTVTELKVVGSDVYGKVGLGWINMNSVSVNAVAVINTKSGGKLNVRDDSCDTTKDAVDQIASGTQVTITAIKAVGGTAWGKIGENRWVSMGLVKLNTTGTTTGGTTSGDTSTGTGTVTGTYQNGTIINVPAGMNANVRAAAGVRNDLVTTVSNGTKVKVFEQTTVDNAVWARIEQGWIYMYYIQLDGTLGTGTTGGTTGGTTTGGTTTGTTTTNPSCAQAFVNTDNLNVRGGAGFGYGTVGTLAQGTQINIYEMAQADNMTWGRTDKGWVSMLHVATTYTGNTGAGTMGTAGGFFSTANIRSAPGTGNAIVGSVMVGARVEVLEQKLYSGQYWGRISQGWIVMQYVTLDQTPNTGAGTGTTDPTTSTTAPTTPAGGSAEGIVALSAVVTVNASDVRYAYDTAAGTTVTETMVNGSKLTISALQPQGGQVWAKFADGKWINISEGGYDVAIVGTANPTGDTMNIRKGAGTSYEDVGDLKKGDKVTVTQLTNVGGSIWGKMGVDQWVSMNLIKMSCTIEAEYVPPRAVLAEVASKATAFTYTDSSLASASGAVNAGDTLKIYDYAGGNLLETDKGWVKLADLGFTGSVKSESGNGINVRQSASAEAEKVGHLDDGTSVSILGYDFSTEGKLWYKIAEGQYVSASLIIF